MAELIEGKTRFYQVSEHFTISGAAELGPMFTLR